MDKDKDKYKDMDKDMDKEKEKDKEKKKHRKISEEYWFLYIISVFYLISIKYFGLLYGLFGLHWLKH